MFRIYVKIEKHTFKTLKSKSTHKQFLFLNTDNVTEWSLLQCELFASRKSQEIYEIANKLFLFEDKSGQFLFFKTYLKVTKYYPKNKVCYFL